MNLFISIEGWIVRGAIVLFGVALIGRRSSSHQRRYKSRQQWCNLCLDNLVSALHPIISQQTEVVLNVDICAMFVASRILHTDNCRFSSEPAVHLRLSKVRLTGSTTFLASVRYVSQSIHAARSIETCHRAANRLGLTSPVLIFGIRSTCQRS